MAEVSDTLGKALLKIQKQNIRVSKDAENPHFKAKYASLGAVIDALKDPLSKAGLVIVQAPSGDERKMSVRTMVMHPESNDFLEIDTPLVLDRDNMQGLGSAITYARRYALVSLFFLDADDDDDGNAASSPKEKLKKAEGSGGYL